MTTAKGGGESTRKGTLTRDRREGSRCRDRLNRMTLLPLRQYRDQRDQRNCGEVEVGGGGTDHLSQGGQLEAAPRTSEPLWNRRQFLDLRGRLPVDLCVVHS